MRDATELQNVLEALMELCADRDDPSANGLMKLALERAIETLEVGMRDARGFDVTDAGNPSLVLDAVLPYTEEVTDGDPELGEYIRARLDLFLARENATILFEQIEASFAADSDNGPEACAQVSFVVDVRVQAEHKRTDPEKAVKEKDGGYISDDVSLDLVPRLREGLQEAEAYVWEEEKSP